jgi:ribonuclease T2
MQENRPLIDRRSSAERTSRPSRPRLASCFGVAMLTLLAALSVQARHHHSKATHAGQAGQFDYYVLSLSWAPTYCLTHAGDGDECASKGYGFVLHGLWPQYEDGGYPEQCDTEFDVPAEAAAVGRTIYPSLRLMSHEWQQHGTCSGLAALDYFRTADRATAAVRIPTAFDAPRGEQTLTAGQIMDLFRSANARMPDRAMAVACSRAAMSEVRVCLTKELSVRSCGTGIHTSCPNVPLQVPASR